MDHAKSLSPEQSQYHAKRHQDRKTCETTTIIIEIDERDASKALKVALWNTTNESRLI